MQIQVRKLEDQNDQTHENNFHFQFSISHNNTKACASCNRVALVWEMASNLKLDISCPVCSEIYKEPVILSCSHSFCEASLQQFWESKQLSECPVCKKRSSKDSFLPNQALKTICESLSGTFIQEKEGTHIVRKEPSRKLECCDSEHPLCLDSKETAAAFDSRKAPLWSKDYLRSTLHSHTVASLCVLIMSPLLQAHADRPDEFTKPRSSFTESVGLRETEINFKLLAMFSISWLTLS